MNQFAPISSFGTTDTKLDWATPRTEHIQLIPDPGVAADNGEGAHALLVDMLAEPRVEPQTPIRAALSKRGVRVVDKQRGDAARCSARESKGLHAPAGTAIAGAVGLSHEISAPVHELILVVEVDGEGRALVADG